MNHILLIYLILHPTIDLIIRFMLDIPLCIILLNILINMKPIINVLFDNSQIIHTKRLIQNLFTFQLMSGNLYSVQMGYFYETTWKNKEVELVSYQSISINYIDIEFIVRNTYSKSLSMDLDCHHRYSRLIGLLLGFQIQESQENQPYPCLDQARFNPINRIP